MRLRRGYTVVELMMALTVLAIGVSGVIAMQKVTVASNQHAKNLALATHIAESWAEELMADATRWNFPTQSNRLSDIGETAWLKKIDAPDVWFLPEYDANLNFGPGFDALGNVTTVAAQTAFCTHVRLSWLYPAATNNGLVRADIRVFWAREGRGAAAPCAAAIADVSAGLTSYHFVHQSTAIRQNAAFQ
jgi:prepilin-type N-terminal cleavage/methylation domain-containing protein